MLIRRMTAVFGKLQGQTLELQDGLNILQASNETGKSTWCAFLLSMFYGINSRERDKAGFIADKNRYAPWSGTAMSGRLDCRFDDTELTLIRTTRRPAAPMGQFQAVYTGTGEPVSGLTGQTCGETLLGVSREVFERSAFIRQAGLPISQDVGLERRIASLITAGEENVSYSPAMDTLKRQLNRRRHNKTGQLPALEAELQEVERQIVQTEALERQLMDARTQAEALSVQKAALEAELSICDRWEASQQRQALTKAETATKKAVQRAADLRQRAEEEKLPENDAIGRLRGAIVNLQMAKKSLDKANLQREEAAKALDEAQAAAKSSPFAGMTPEEAEKAPLDLEPRPRLPIWTAALLALLGICLGGAVYIALHNLPLAIGSGCGLFGASLLIAGLRIGKRQKRWEAKAQRLRQRQQEALDRYVQLYQAVEAAQEEASAKASAAESLSASLTSTEQGILLEVSRFAPAVSDLSAADAALRSCAVRRKELVEAEAAAREAKLRYELLSQQMPANSEEDAVPSPARPRSETAAALERTRTALDNARSEADRLTGQLHALGDPAELHSAAGQLKEDIRTLEREYEALRLAISALDSANTTLQTRFSPALGRRTAEIFSQLTDGRYSNVVLDRALRLSAEPAGEGVYREAALLSAGAADQLYLAARLAICDLVLPADAAVPIVLDDALTNFDDIRCAAALRHLRNEAEKRQILLFTCHSREADFFAGDKAVSIQHLSELTNAGEMV